MTVFFDIGSTLIEGPSQGPGKRLASALGITDLAAVNRLLFQTPLESPEHAASEFASCFDVPRQLALREIDALWRAQLSEAFLLPGAMEVIGAFRAAGVRRAYISNIWPPFYKRFIEAFPEETGCTQILSFRTGRMKPDLALYRQALEESGAAAADCVMVGDTYENDIAPGIALGMRTVWVLHRPEKERDALAAILNGSKAPPSLTLCSIGELTPELL